MPSQNGTKQPETQVINFANAMLVPLPDGSGAVASFNIMGAFDVTITFPGQVIDDFIAQWMAVKQEMATTHKMMMKIQRSKI